MSKLLCNVYYVYKELETKDYTCLKQYFKSNILTTHMRTIGKLKSTLFYKKI